MKKFFINMGKKYAIKSLNDLFDKNKDNVKAICDQIQIWTTKINDISSLLTKISARCADGNLEAEEVDDSIEEVELIIKNW